LRAHYKNTFETGRAVRGLKLKKAIRYMEDVIEHKQVVPFKKHTGCIGRTA
jgi:large subunit ribosomal protein L17e